MVDVIGNIKDKLDIVDVVGEYVTLERAGRNVKALCPFHAENTPSFLVFPDKQNWHCFGSCGEGGDVLDFVQRIEGWDFSTTLHHLARRAGVELAGLEGQRRVSEPQKIKAWSRSDPVKASVGAPSQAWREQGAAFVDYCQTQLFDGDNEGITHLRGRGLTDDTIRAWGLGWHEKARRQSAGKWGLTGKPIYLPRGVVIPWRVDGAVYHVKNRLFEVWKRGDTPKYMRVRGGQPTLYGLDHLKGRETVVICEGELDAVLLWQEVGDLVDVVAIGSKDSKPPINALFRLVGASRWLVALDTDADTRARDWVSFSNRVERVRVPNGKDVTEFYQSGGDLRAWVLDYIGGDRETVTLSLPGDTGLGVPAGAWERQNGRLVATFTRAELATAVGLAMEQKRAELERRLLQGLDVMGEWTPADGDAEAERLLAHWDKLNAEYARVVDRLRALEGAR
jgi:DNA primase